MKIEPFKMRVTPEQSRRVQEIIFENGGEWRDGQTTVINTNRPCLAFELSGDGDGISAWSDPPAGFPTFMDAEVPEIMYYQFINKYGKQMKNLKLEVGKTYLNRKGERVKIVHNDKCPPFPFEGDDSQHYAADGLFAGPPSSELDLIAEAPPTFRTFKIPENTREISVSETDGRIVIEFVPEVPRFKEGDVCINDRGSVYIFREDDGDGYHLIHVGMMAQGNSLTESTGCFHAGRLATPAEAQQLFDALKKNGKRWNPETMKIEELTERDRIRGWLKNRGYAVNGGLTSVIEQYIKHREAQVCK